MSDRSLLCYGDSNTYGFDPASGGRMVRTGSCYTCRDCGTNTGCS